MPQPKLNKHIPTILALSVVILLSCTTYGQNRNELTVNGFAGYGSNALNNEFMNKLVLGGNISNSLKDQTLNHTNKYNRIGADLTYEVYFKNYSDTLFDNAPNWRLYFGLGSYTQYSSTFTRDLYKTIFYGNKVFGDQEASIGGSQFFLLDFKKFIYVH